MGIFSQEENMCKPLQCFCGLFVAIALTACHTMPVNNPPAPSVSDASANQIAEAATSVSKSLTDLEAVEKANMAPTAARLYPQVAQVSIPGISSVNWNGPIEPLLRQVCKSAGYRLRIIGPAPLPSIVVTIHLDQALNADIVRDAALQAGNRVSVRSIPSAKTLELRYLSH